MAQSEGIHDPLSPADSIHSRHPSSSDSLSSSFTVLDEWSEAEYDHWYNRFKVHLIDFDVSFSHSHYLFRSGLPLVETQTAVYTNNAIPDNADGQTDRLDYPLLLRTLKQSAGEAGQNLIEPVYVIDINLMGGEDPRDVLRVQTEVEYWRSNESRGCFIKWDTVGTRKNYTVVRQQLKERWKRAKHSRDDADQMEMKMRSANNPRNEDNATFESYLQHSSSSWLIRKDQLISRTKLLYDFVHSDFHHPSDLRSLTRVCKPISFHRNMSITIES